MGISRTDHDLRYEAAVRGAVARKHQCAQCDYRSATPVELARHVRSMHPRPKSPPAPAPHGDPEIALLDLALAVFAAAPVDDRARARVAEHLRARYAQGDRS
jgi:hypothetical protein